MSTPNPSNLDANQCIQGAFDEATGSLRVAVSAPIVNGAVEVAIDASTDNIAIKDPNSGNTLKINADGSINTDAIVTVPTTVNQGNPNTLANAWPVIPTDGTNFQSFTALNESKVTVTQALPAGSNNIGSLTNITGTISLPTGAATNAELITINSTLGSPFQAGGSIGNTSFGSSQVGTWINRIEDTSGNSLSSTSNALDINLKSSSITLPVSGTITANQGTNPWTISGNVNASQSGVWTTGRTWNLLNTTDSVNIGNFPATQAVTQSGTWNINNISGTVSLPTNAAQETGGHLASIDSKMSTDANGFFQVATPTRLSSTAITGSSTAQFECSGLGTLIVQITGTWSATFQFEASVLASPSPTDWFVLSGQDYIALNGQILLNTSTNGVFIFNGSGIKLFRLRPISPITGTTVINFGSSGNASAMATILNEVAVVGTVSANLQDGSGNLISSTGGALDVNLKTSSITVPVSGTVAATQGTSPWVNNISQFGGNNIVTGTGASGVGIPRVTIANDSNILATQSGTWTVQQGTPPWTIQGDSSSGAAKAGNPVQIGGVFNTTQPTVTSGQTVEAQSTARGAQIVATGVDTFSVTANAGTNLNTSALALDTSVNGLLLSQSSTTSSEKGPLVQGAVTTNAPSYTTAQTNPLSLDTSGLLRVSLKDTPANTNKFLVTADPITFASPQHVIVDSGTIAVTQSTTPWTIQGDSASGVTAAGNPVQIGGVFNTTQPTVTTGQSVQAQATARGALIVATGTDNFTVQQGTPPWQIVGNVASGGADSGNPAKVAAVFNSTLPTVTNGQRVDNQADANGRLIVNATPVDGVKTTYSASINALATAASATDIFTLTGSATKTVRINFVQITATQTTAATTNIFLLKRSTANSGGTSTTPTKVAHDSTNAAATATVNAYTANPTTGVLVGSIRTIRTLIPAVSAGTTESSPLQWDFGIRPGQAIVLRGTSEVFAINLNGVTLTGSSFDICIEWSEEA